MLDREIVTLTGKKEPSVVIFATAMSDEPSWVDMTVQQFAPYTSHIEAINLIAPVLSDEEIATKVANADIVYVTGGMTETLMGKWYEHNVDKALIAAYQNGTVICGSSAGAICWSHQGLNDFIDGRYDFIAGLGLVPIWFGPHYQDELWCDFDKHLAEKAHPDKDGSPCTAYALTNNTALVFENDTCTTMKVSDSEKIYKFTYENGSWTKEEC